MIWKKDQIFPPYFKFNYMWTHCTEHNLVSMKEKCQISIDIETIAPTNQVPSVSGDRMRSYAPCVEALSGRACSCCDWAKSFTAFGLFRSAHASPWAVIDYACCAEEEQRWSHDQTHQRREAHSSHIVLENSNVFSIDFFSYFFFFFGKNGPHTIAHTFRLHFNWNWTGMVDFVRKMTNKQKLWLAIIELLCKWRCEAQQ